MPCANRVNEALGGLSFAPCNQKKWPISQEVDTESVYFSNPRQGRTAKEIASKMIVGLINQMKQKAAV